MSQTRAGLGALKWSAIGNVGLPLAGLALSIVLAHSLGPAGRGEVAAATAPLMLVTVAASLGLPESVTYHVAKGRLGARTLAALLAVTVVVGVICTVGLIASATVLAGAGTQLSRTLVQCALFLTPALVLGVVRGVAAGMSRWRAVAVERWATGLLRLIGVAVLVGQDRLTAHTAAVLIAGTPVVAGLVYLPLLRKQYGSSVLAEAINSSSSTANHVSYGLKVWVGSLSGILLSRIDQSVMAPLAGVHELGLYAVAVSVAEIPALVSATLREVLFTRASASVDALSVARAARVSSVAILILTASISGASYWLFAMMFGSEFREAIPAFLILSLGVVLGNGGSLAGVLLSAAGRPGVRSMGLIFAVVTNVALLLVLAPRLGAVGAAIATLVGTLVAVVWNFRGLRRLWVPWTSFIGLRREDVIFVRTLSGK